jgi:uncharacterized protein (UPF0297 family)
MKDESFIALSSQLKDSKADKFHTLLIHFRENNLSEEEISEKLNVNANAYYTLKSRLYNKIQEFLTSTLSGPKADLIKNVANIPNLIFDTPRDTAMAVLAKLEKDLVEYDMPYELTNVYNALKKLHIHSPKYYEYTQLYNKHVAYTIALDKAEDLLANFHKTLGEYYASRNKTLLEVLWLIKKEMEHLCRLYESHHLTVYGNILNISFALFVPLPEAVENDDPVEDILAATDEILRNYPKDVTYQHLVTAFNFLSFEYYHHLKLHKKEVQFFEAVNSRLSSFMLYNFCTFTSRFLVSKMERYNTLNDELKLYEENKQLQNEYVPDTSDIPNYVNYVKYLAAGAFHAKKYSEAVTLLNGLLNDISFKNYSHSEIEVKLLLALSYSMLNKYDPAHSLVRSASRKIREMEDAEVYENATVFIKMLSLQMDSNSKSAEEKLVNLRNKFLLLNQGPSRMLEYLKLSDDFIKVLAKSIK